MPMKERPLGNSGLQVGPLALGGKCVRLSGGSAPAGLRCEIDLHKASGF